jgi:hypothetical protein
MDGYHEFTDGPFKFEVETKGDRKVLRFKEGLDVIAEIHMTREAAYALAQDLGQR